jgi:hypothetical protein
MASKFLASANASVRKMAAPALSRLQQVTGGSGTPHVGGGEREAIKVSFEQAHGRPEEMDQVEEGKIFGADTRSIWPVGLQSYLRIRPTPEGMVLGEPCTSRLQLPIDLSPLDSSLLTALLPGCLRPDDDIRQRGYHDHSSSA